jgi:EAL domain-containing protein (putative c-di-GMP-specific phosphodiesterase class I)
VKLFIERVKHMGFLIGIDDFGMAHSSLHEISEIYYDILKIDKSFVDRLGRDLRNDEVVRLIIDMAHRVGAKTVAEGVEHADQLAWLERNGCDYIQGYLFAKPLPPEAFAKWYNAQKKRGR